MTKDEILKSKSPGFATYENINQVLDWVSYSVGKEDRAAAVTAATIAYNTTLQNVADRMPQHLLGLEDLEKISKILKLVAEFMEWEDATPELIKAVDSRIEELSHED